MHSQDNKYPLNGLTASYEAGITPFVNFTINTNYVPGKIINFEVRFDSNGDGTYETKALFSPYTTQWDQAANDNQHREEKIRAQFTGYSNGAPGNMVNGKIQMAFWRTDGITDNPGTAVNEDWLTIYCGAFTPAKESWVVLPFKWANLNPVAVIGPDPDQKPTDWWLEPPEDPTSPHYGQYVANYSVEMFGSDSYSPIGVNITSYMWEFSYKGHTGTGEIAKCNNHNFCKQQGHRYYYPGIYWIQLWVTDANGRVGWADHWINVTKDPGVIPEIETFLIEPNPALVDTEVDLTVFATDPDGHASLPIDVIYYKWDYDGDGIWDTNATESGIAKHIYEEPGTYTVKVAALDGPENNPDTLTGVKEMVLVIKENDGPIINFTVSTDFKKVNYPEHNSIMVIVGEEVSLDFSNCNDPDNLPGFDTGTHYSLQVKADFKDGLGAEIQYGNNVVYNYTYKEAGPYNMYSIAIIVSDGDIESPVTFYVIIDVPPKADAGPDQGTPRPGLEDLSTEDSVFFDGSASFDPNDDTDKNEIISGSEIDNCTYQWDFGDNTTSSLSNRPYANHSYSAPKTYEVLLTVTDPRGQISRDKAKVIVLSPNSPPVAVIDLTGGDTTYETFQEILFNSDSSFDPDNETNGRVLKWFWDFGDGNNSTEKNPSYRYADGNQYTVSLKVVDDRGDSSVVTTKVVQINNRKPEAKIRRLETTKWETKKPYTFTSVSTDMDGDVVFFEWTIDDVILDENTNEIEYTFDDSGPHKIVLTVKDDDGAVNDMSDEFSVYSIDIVKPVTEKSPGFELALVVMAIALVGLVATRRKRRV
jgi:PKD repeat protein